MNSHERRTAERYWTHCINLSNDDERYYDIMDWIYNNFGSCSFKRRRGPRWCWRPVYSDVGNFARAWTKTQLFFHNDKDFTWLLMKWDNQ